MKKWLNYDFNSNGWSRVRENHNDAFDRFFLDFRRTLKAKLPKNLTVARISKGHFYISGHVLNVETGKYAYWSISDVRFFVNDWYTDVLVRTTKDDHDFTGGQNRYCSFDDLPENLAELTS